MEKYIDSDLCKECGGVCCKQNGCIFLPQDFEKMTFNYLKNEIDKGYISIAGQPFNGFYNNGWSFLLYLRARNCDAPIVDLITSGGPCSLLTDTGCKLDEEHRPTLGLLVKPTKVGGPCEKMFPQEALMSWINYNDVLCQLIKHYTKKDVVDIIIEQTKEKNRSINNKRALRIELKAMEEHLYYYLSIMNNNPYYTSKEAKRMLSPKYYSWKPKNN